MWSEDGVRVEGPVPATKPNDLGVSAPGSSPEAASPRQAVDSTGAGFESTIEYLWEAGYDMRPGEDLLGHREVKTTTVYTHVSN